MRAPLPSLLLLATFVACDPGSPAAPPEDPFESAVHACAAFVACDLEWPNLGWCVESVLGRSLSTLEPRADDVACVRAARGDCDAIRACIGWSVAPSDGTCVARCDGDTLVSCIGGDVDRVACPHTAPGNTCVTFPREPGDTRPPAHACSSPECPSYGGSSCVGDDVATCGFESYRSIELCPEGTRCELYPDPTGTVSYYGCVGLGAACTESRCEGTVAHTCIQGHEGPLVDCADRGLACVNWYCDVTDPPCVGTTPGQSCEGDVLAYCEFGRTVRVDCRALGFASCEPTASMGFHTASCAPAGGRVMR